MAALPIAPLSDRSDMAWLAFIKAVCWGWRDVPVGAAALADVAELLVWQLAQHARALVRASHVRNGIARLGVLNSGVEFPGRGRMFVDRGGG